MASNIPQDLIYASFFFIDIVGLSNPTLSTETQRSKVKILNQTIYDCPTFSNYAKENLLILPTGDGMLICFKNGLEEPINLAIEFHERLSKYNQKTTHSEKIETRIGCNVGHVFVVEDIYGNINLWGPGAILARRIMDLGDSNHILISDELAKDLTELSDKYTEILHPVQNFGIKHGENLLVYSLFGDGFGNFNIPKEKKALNLKSSQKEKNAQCEKIIFNIILKDKDEPVRFERQYYITSNLSEPINDFVAGIVLNSKEEFNSLFLKTYDENNSELEISQIISPTPYTKQIKVKLENPIYPGQKGRQIKLVYNSKLSQNIFENFFLIDTNNFELNFSHFSNVDYSPSLFYFDNEQGTKNFLDPSSKIVKGVFTIHKWEKTQGFNENDMIEISW